jgi:hypothetical protein
MREVSYVVVVAVGTGETRFDENQKEVLHRLVVVERQDAHDFDVVLNDLSWQLAGCQGYQRHHPIGDAHDLELAQPRFCDSPRVRLTECQAPVATDILSDGDEERLALRGHVSRSACADQHAALSRLQARRQHARRSLAEDLEVVAGRVAEARLRVPQGGRDALAECTLWANGTRRGGPERPVVRGMANVAAPAARWMRLHVELVDRREVVRRCNVQGGNT